MMATLASKAYEIYRSEGLDTLLLQARMWLERNMLPDTISYSLSKILIQRRMKDEEELSDILDTVLNHRPGVGKYEVRSMQLREEILALTEIVGEQNPETVMEIGTAHGGTFYIWSRLPSSSKLLSLDLPDGEFGGGYQSKKVNLFRIFDPEAQMEFVRANSHDPSTKDTVRDLLNGQKVDFLFIDGDHSYQGVKQDFEMYRDFVADDGIIAFHDIVHHPNNLETVKERGAGDLSIEDRHLNWAEHFTDCEVDKFWSEIKSEYTTEEFISHQNQTWGGIGVIFL
jgi:cephalosporin hydroxylase